MNTLFKNSSRFHSLSLKDLLEGRDLFHYHLMNKKNVVATAVGLYRIRKHDPPMENYRRLPNSPRRTLFNSVVRPNSWPCVYVFVSEWNVEATLSKVDPSDVIPQNLILPDGRVIPVCVIEARKQSTATDLHVDPGKLVPRNLIGPGVAIFNEDGQGLTRVATAGCVVQDGERYYMMTSRHALGVAGTPIKALQSSRRPRIGVNSSIGLTREKFGDIYPGFPSHRQHLLMDIGLVDLDDITQWKSDFPGISPVSPVLDLYDNSFDLKLIGMKVVGNAAVSGKIRGEIQGLFYRFKSMGGFEYISDFLIGPETSKEATKSRTEKAKENAVFAVHHGDSGTVLFIENEELTAEEAHYTPPRWTYHPFALLWGKNEFIESGKQLTQPFALATSLSTALDRLNLDFVRDINFDQDYVWGWVGHYVIGGALPFAIRLLKNANLRKFTEKNLDLLTISPDSALGNDPKVLDTGATDASHPHFVPLADVPDNVWKSNVNFYQTVDEAGQKHRVAGPGNRRQNDNPNHFADMDLPFKGYDTFLKFNLAHMDPVPNPDDWLDYYKSLKAKYDAWAAALGKGSEPEQKHWGALPFRVWQLFDAMVQAASHGNQPEFLVAGGVLIHYVGDACQPLHTSYLSQGDPDRLVPRHNSPGKKMEADGVHTGYEDDMINYGFQQKGLVNSLQKEIERQEKSASEKIVTIASGSDAAKAVIRLIASTHKTIPPREIIDRWVEYHPLQKKDRDNQMWTKFGERTVKCMARGSRYLAHIWLAAWKAGSGNTKIGEGAKQTQPSISKLYNNPAFVRSVRLDEYSKIL